MTTPGPEQQRSLLATISVASRSAFLSDLRSRLEKGQGFSIATMNLDHAVKLRQDPGFRSAYAAHTHVTADGRPIVWLSALAGRQVDLVTGSDLVEPLVALCAELGMPVAFVGSTPTVLAEAARRLQARHAGLDVVACLAPPMGFDPHDPVADALIDDLARSGAKVCLLALGAPKQETFAARASQVLSGMGFASVGAGLDFVAGAQTRAPRLVRLLALEWLWRLLGSPRRLFRRYAACLAVLPVLARGAMSQRFSRQPGGVD